MAKLVENESHVESNYFGIVAADECIKYFCDHNLELSAKSLTLSPRNTSERNYLAGEVTAATCCAAKLPEVVKTFAVEIRAFLVPGVRGAGTLNELARCEMMTLQFNYCC